MTFLKLEIYTVQWTWSTKMYISFYHYRLTLIYSNRMALFSKVYFPNLFPKQNVNS